MRRKKTQKEDFDRLEQHLSLCKRLATGGYKGFLAAQSGCILDQGKFYLKASSGPGVGEAEELARNDVAWPCVKAAAVTVSTSAHCRPRAKGLATAAWATIWEQTGGPRAKGLATGGGAGAGRIASWFGGWRAVQGKGLGLASWPRGPRRI